MKGFTLLEFSIVLILIGLVVGGVLLGSDLIRASERRAVISEVQNFKTAITTFKGQYRALPGDMNYAKSIWSECIDVAGNNCNGNNNGKRLAVKI